LYGGRRMADDEVFRSLLTRIDQWLAQNRPDYYAKLQKGVSNDQLDQFENRFNFKLPDTFKLLYSWRNGQEESCSASFVGNRMFMSLGSIASTKEMLDGMIGEDFEDPEHWKEQWVPFLENGGGDYLCIDLGSGNQGTAGQLVEFWHADKDRKTVYPSLKDWAQQLQSSMESGAYKVF
jgi:cell wall assembly regulator SMI1